MWGGVEGAVELQDECFLPLPPGLRHFAALQMTGVGDKATGSVQLFPLNGELAGTPGGVDEGVLI